MRRLARGAGLAGAGGGRRALGAGVATFGAGARTGTRRIKQNAIKQRAEQLQLSLSDDDIKTITTQIKALADQKNLSLDDVDVLLRSYHSPSVEAEVLESIPANEFAATVAKSPYGD